MDKAKGGEDAEVLRKKTVGELKELLRARGVDFRDCIEKEDLVNRALETGGIGAPTTTSPSAANIPFKIVERREKLGGLDTIVIENHPHPETLVVICHGYGANNEDLAPIGHETLGSMGNETRLRFLFPNAPLSLGGPSRAWWHIDINRLMGLMMKGPSGLEQATREVPEGLDSARQSLAQLIQQARTTTPIPMSKVLVGGFSQGSMLSTDYALHCGGHLPETYPQHQLYPSDTPAGLAVWSGTLINSDKWKDFATKIRERKGANAIRVLQSHGTQDALLPFSLATQLRSVFETTGGFQLTFEEFRGGHTIPPSVIRRFVELLRAIK